MLFLMATHMLMFGNPMPMTATGYHWFWFGISGLIGFTIGDSFLFRGYVLIGPRLTMLLMSLSPIFGAILGWIFLGESLCCIEIFAISITIFGIIMVLYDKDQKNRQGDQFLWGIICGLGASFCQALGYFASKKGLLHMSIPAISGNLIRVMSGVFFIWFAALLQGKSFETLRRLKNRRADIAMLAGAFFGPFVGVWLSLIAIQYSHIGIASTLMALPPVILIPMSHWIFREKVTHISMIGTVIALTGVTIIFLV